MQFLCCCKEVLENSMPPYGGCVLGLLRVFDVSIRSLLFSSVLFFSHIACHFSKGRMAAAGCLKVGKGHPIQFTESAYNAI